MSNSTEIEQGRQQPDPEADAIPRPWEDPVIKEIERIESLPEPMEYETKLLLSMAKEAQLTGKIPDLSSLQPQYNPADEIKNLLRP